ncbi:MAG: AAA family ATPase [Gammaproteobacteria bacterium]|nr:AAA family ATPase [Gammaproteobacteria bacterium]
MDNPDHSLNLELVPSTLMLFGLAGSGKSYVGDLIAQQTGWFVYHADEDITDEMRLALEQQRPFSDEMRDRYFSIIVEKILSLQNIHSRLLVTQAVYKQRHRDFLLSYIPNMEMIYVQADDAVIEKRLLARNGEANAKSAAALRNDFEPPSGKCKTLINNTDDSNIVRQLNRLYAGSVPLAE